MSKDPAVLFYTSDFLTGTMTMTNDQVGMYIRLLCLQHQKNFLSEKDMLSICKSYDEDVFSKFEKNDQGYYNERMQVEYDRRKKYSESRSNNRKKKDMLIISKTYEDHMETETETITIKENKSKIFKKPTVEQILNEFPNFNAEHFFNYYESNGWMVGKNKMKNWKATVKTWMSKDYNQQTQIVANRPKMATLD
tara:strand:- start:1619 stop:2200 length:582 start_codon:yes stop_codon:yes gene_type:complete